MNANPDKDANAGPVETLDRIMLARRSTRAFLSKPVSPDVVKEILAVSGWAPSGNNIQPWRVHVVSGTLLQRLIESVSTAFDRADGSHRPEYHYYPREFFEPYLGRRRKSGWGLYGLLGIQKGDTERMRLQHRRNFEFFGAPIGLIFSIDRRMEQGSWLDYGMFLQNVMLAARARGLATCAQGAWIDYHRLIADLLQFGEHEQLVCGMALGYPDPEAPENTLVPDRASLSEYVVFHE